MKVIQSAPASLDLTEGEGGGTRRIPLDKDVIRIGREPELDVVIDAAAAVVSRHHAEVRKLGGQWVVVDQGSFNGTLINDYRITEPTPVFDGDRIQLGIGGPLLRLQDPAHPAPGGIKGTGLASGKCRGSIGRAVRTVWATWRAGRAQTKDDRCFAGVRLTAAINARARCSAATTITPAEL